MHNILFQHASSGWEEDRPQSTPKNGPTAEDSRVGVGAQHPLRVAWQDDGRCDDFLCWMKTTLR